MEDNYSDTEHIIVGKRNDKFQQRIKTLKGLITSLLVFGAGLTIFSAITWNNSSNDILRSLAVTGLVTVFASIIGLVGCNRCLKHFEVVKVTKMKLTPGQEALLIFFYFNFVLFCAYLLFGTWCFFYQDDATAWLDAKYADHTSWERDFKGIKLDTVQNNLRLLLTIAGALSLIVATINFACIHYAIKISQFFETIHTVVQVQNLVLVLISFLIIYAGAIAKSYYNVPYVEETEPEYLPQVLIFTGIAMILVAYLGFFASRAESKVGLIAYTIFCVILMINFLIFIVLLNFGSQVLQQQFEEKCNEVMPYFHKNFYEAFGCNQKYVANSTEPTRLQCPKYQIAQIWEQNVDVSIDEQSESYGCLNQSCCVAMISFVKGKFNFLAAFCIVAFFFSLVAIMTSQYMYKKIKKYNTQILSHKNDKFIFYFMLLCTIGLSASLYMNMPQGPKGMPQPEKSEHKLDHESYMRFYDLHQDRDIGLGQINDDGWWSFDRVVLFQQQSQDSSDNVKAELSVQAFPSGEFMINGIQDSSIDINNDSKNNKIVIKGKTQAVNDVIKKLLYRPGCVLNKDNHIEMNVTFTQSRMLQQTNATSDTSDLNHTEQQQHQQNTTTSPNTSMNQTVTPQQTQDQQQQNTSTQQQQSTSVHQSQEQSSNTNYQYDTLIMGEPKRYKISTNMNSGVQRRYRGKIIEENLEATGSHNYFKELSTTNDVKVTVSKPNYKDCTPINVQVDSHGVFEFNMTLMNMSIPYLIKVQAEKPMYAQPISFDYFVGGLPQTDTVELGTYAFYMSDNKLHNVSGRLYEAFTNKTFSDDYTLSVYQGYGELNNTRYDAYEVLDHYGNGVYYTGIFDIYDLKAGPYVAVIDTPMGYIKNFQRFYALPTPPFTKHMRSIPLVPELSEGELALVLTWGYAPKDLDLHVEFVGSPTILCKADYSTHACGGVRYMSDAIEGGDHGSDVIKFDYVGDYQYLVYVSLYRSRNNQTQQPSPSQPQKPAQQQNPTEVPLTDSQAQLKVFSPYYSWPVYIFDIPAAASNPTANYWTVFCLDAKNGGLRGLTPINQYTQGPPDVSMCEDIYGTPEVLVKHFEEVSNNGEEQGGKLL